MNAMGQEDWVDVLDDEDRVAMVLSPLRRRILGRLHHQPDSAVGLARAFGVSRQKLNYHLRELERTGFLEVASTRQRRGFVERTLRPTARAYLLSPAVLGALAADPDAIKDRFSSSYLIAAASRLVQDVTVLRQRAEEAGQSLATFTLQTDIAFRSPAERTAFVEELTAACARLAAAYHDESPGSRRYRIIVGGHPVITKKEGQHTAETEEK
jgi:DNA-binding transcriptional ArsR family regulator